MSVSSVKRGLLAAILGVLAVSPGFAQTGGDAPPVSLSPPRPVVLPGSDTPQPLPPPVSGPSGIQVDALSSLSPDSVGTLGPAEGGLGSDMWRGTPRALADRLLPQLPAGTGSAAMRGLMRRLLLSTAIAPEGPGTGSLLGRRLDRLTAMGDRAALADLLKVSPERGTDDSAQRAEADAQFLAGEVKQACAVVVGRIGASDDLHWRKALVFCQMVSGEGPKASLGASLLREQKIDDAPYFELLDAVAAPGKVTVASLPRPTALHIAMARVGKVKLPADVAGSGDPMVLAAVAVSPGLPPETQIDAAEKAEAAGALPTDTLRHIYGSVAFSKAEMANSLSKAEDNKSGLGRALLYRAVLAQTVPTAQAEAIAKALAHARDGGRYATAARVYQVHLQKLPPLSDHLWLAPEAIRALLAAGDEATAKTWIDALATAAQLSEEYQGMQAQLAPLTRLAGGAAAPWSGNSVEAWWVQRNQPMKPIKGAKDTKTANPATADAAILFTLLDAFGDVVPEALWREALGAPARDPGTVPSAALWRTLEQAAAGKRVAETTALALIGLGEGGPAKANPMFLRHAITALRMVGLEKDARALAVETALALGL